MTVTKREMRNSADNLPDGRNRVPVRVYLDQADWSNLAKKVRSEDEAKLRELGKRGDVLFIATEVHFSETAKGEGQFACEMAKLIHGFPGAHILVHNASSILRSEVDALFDYVSGRPVPSKSGEYGFVPAASQSAQQLYDRIVAWTGGAEMRRISARQTASARYFNKGITKKDQMLERKAMLALLEGNLTPYQSFFRTAPVVNLEKHPDKRISAIGKAVTRISEICSSLGMETRREHRRFGHDAMAIRAFLVVLDKLPFSPVRLLIKDQVFLKLFIWSSLKMPSRWGQLSACYDIWKNNSALAKSWPSLYAWKCVEEQFFNDSNRDYKDSDLHDAEHTAYLPFMDIFTCDKRTEAVLRDYQKLTGKQVSILRSDRLSEVVAEIKRKLPYQS